MLSVQTATDIALAHREIEEANKLLADVSDQISKTEGVDIRDAFGRRVYGLELGLPLGNSSKRIFHLDWKLAKPVLEAHIAQMKAELKILNEKALIEAGSNDEAA